MVSFLPLTAAAKLAMWANPGIARAAWQITHPWLTRLLGYPGIGPVLVAAERINILFIHVPKTGGTSINQMLYGTQQHAHPTWAQVAAAHPRLFRSSLKFAVIRDPLQRFVSAYNYLAEGGRNTADALFAAGHVAPFRNLNSFVNVFKDPKWRHKLMAWWHFRPQHEFVCDRRGACRVNRLVPYERLSEGLSEILPVKPSFLPKLNATFHPRLTVYELSGDSIALLRSVYAADFRLYDWASTVWPEDCYGRVAVVSEQTAEAHLEESY